jgi:hypothetical protein
MQTVLVVIDGALTPKEVAAIAKVMEEHESERRETAKST